jgi:pimeloyl-ACP methyl ester carboxylesterase
MKTKIQNLMCLCIAALIALVPNAGAKTSSGRGYAHVNGLAMYYEIHGAGAPLVLLHGGVSTIDNSFGGIIPTLAKTRRVIAIEQQGHGHTADIDRPLRYEQMAEDTNALLTQLGVERADFFGWSDGGVVALRVAMRHPERVRKLVVLSAGYDNGSLQPGDVEAMAALTPDMIPPVYHEAYAKVAPDPTKWPTLVAKIKDLALTFKGWSKDEVRAIRSPVLLMVGDRDLIRTDYAVEMAGLLAHGELAILPGCDHFAIHAHPDWVLSLSRAFLD